MNKQLANSLILLFFISSGSLTYLLYQGIIIIACIGTHHVDSPPAHLSKAKIIFFKNGWKQELKNISAIQDDYPAYIESIIKAWLCVVEEEVTHKKVALETLSLSLHDVEIVINFARSPFLKQSSVHDKIYILESLRRTLEPYLKKSTVYMRLLVHHEPLADQQLDFSRPLLLVAKVTTTLTTTINTRPLRSILIEPFSAPTRTGGRMINDENTERIFTLQTAYALRDQLQRKGIPCTIIRTEHMNELERLQHINAWGADLYIRLGAYASDDHSHHLDYYTHPCNNQMQDSRFVSIYHANDLVKDRTDMIVHQINAHLMSMGEIKTHRDIIPIIYLRGLSCPAVYCELGISKFQNSGRVQQVVAGLLESLNNSCVSQHI